MFYRTSYSRNNDNVNQDLNTNQYFDLKSIDYKISEKEIVVTIQFDDKTVVQKIVSEDINQLHDGSIVDIIFDSNNLLKIVERYKLSENTRSDPINYINYDNQFELLQIAVPSVNDSFLNMDYFINIPTIIKITSNMDIIEENDKIIYLRDFLPKLNFINEVPSSISKNDVIELQFNVMWHDQLYTHPITVYPKARQGYVNKTKVITKDGIGSFKFVPLYLDSGDIVEIELGYKHRSNVLNANILIEE